MKSKALNRLCAESAEIVQACCDGPQWLRVEGVRVFGIWASGSQGLGGLSVGSRVWGLMYSSTKGAGFRAGRFRKFCGWVAKPAL